MDMVKKLNEKIREVKGLCCLTSETLDFPIWVFDWKPQAERKVYNYDSIDAHPKKQASIVNDLGDRDGIIMTHCPWIITDLTVFQVLVLSEKKIEHPDFNTFGASVNGITMKLFDQTHTIGVVSARVLNDYNLRLKKGDDPTEIINKVNRTFGDSVEKTLLINYAMDLEEKLRGKKCL